MQVCPNCSASCSDKAKFCGKCGSQLKCSNCEAPLISGNRFCESCGTEVTKPNEAKSSGSPNKIKFQENKDGRFIEAEFSDAVGKDITTSLSDMLTPKQELSAGIDLPPSTTRNEEAQTNTSDGTDNIEDAEFELETRHAATTQSDPIPSLRSVVLKNLPADEAEWIIVYGFYKSNFGKKEFTRNDLLEAYKETSRKGANLSYNIKKVVTQNCFNPINDTEFSLLQNGLDKAKQIINRTTSSPVKRTSRGQVSSTGKKLVPDSGNRGSKKESSTRRVSKGYEVLDLGFDETMRKTLRGFYDEKSPKTGKDMVLVLGYWLQKEGKLPGFGVNEIYTAIQIVYAKTPKDIGQVFRDIKKDGKMTKDTTLKQYKLNHVGDDYVKFDLPPNG